MGSEMTCIIREKPGVFEALWDAAKYGDALNLHPSASDHICHYTFDLEEQVEELQRRVRHLKRQQGQRN